MAATPRAGKKPAEKKTTPKAEPALVRKRTVLTPAEKVAKAKAELEAAENAAAEAAQKGEAAVQHVEDTKATLVDLQAAFETDPSKVKEYRNAVNAFVDAVRERAKFA